MTLRSLLFAITLATPLWAYPPMPEAEQEKQADVVAWCAVSQIELLETPRIDLGLSSQLRRYTLKVTEVVKGEAAVGAKFSLEFAHYELLSTDQIRVVQPEILVWEITRRPELKIGQEYRVYLKKRGDQLTPLEGRWSILTARPIKNLYEKWVGRKESAEK